MRRRHRTDTRRVERLGEQRVFHERHGVSLYLMLLEFFRRGGRALLPAALPTRRRSQLYTADEGFSSGRATASLLAVSGFAGIIRRRAGGLPAPDLGYANYIDHYVSWMTGSSRGWAAPPRRWRDAFQIVNELQNSPAPSMLKTIKGRRVELSALRRCFGLIIGVIARAPKPFGKDSNE